MSVVNIIGRLALATLVSGLIGFERERAHKAAGLRTHSLVGIGAAIFSIVSIVGFEGPDESRIAAQVVTGVGFLGAGAIFREGASVKGLTTAAGLWAVAALGVAAGSGQIVLTAIGAVAVLGVLYSLRAIDESVARRSLKTRDRLEIHISDATKLEALLKFTRHIDPDAEQSAFRRAGEKGGILTLAVDPDHSSMVSEMLASHKIVTAVEPLSPLYWPQKKKGN